MPELVSPFAGDAFGRGDADALASVMKAVAEPARLQLLGLLTRGEWATYELVGRLGRLTQPTVSHHLTVLLAAGLVTARKDGRFMRYRAAEAGFAELAAVFRPGRAR